jgi:Mrp family chromosome partitioning ATPase
MEAAGAVIVSTPQDLALIDATRAIDLFRKMDVPILGFVENMSGYVCPHCGELSDPFGSGGAEAAAKVMSIPFWAECRSLWRSAGCPMREPRPRPVTARRPSLSSASPSAWPNN